MPQWLLSILISEAERLITPELIAKAEAWAKQFVCCELKKAAASTTSGLDDALVATVAAALGVDLTKCPA